MGNNEQHWDACYGIFAILKIYGLTDKQVFTDKTGNCPRQGYDNRSNMKGEILREECGK